MKQALNRAPASWFSIPVRANLAFLCVLIPLLVTGVLFYRTMLAAQASDRRLDHSQEVLQAVAETRALLNRAESATRGFVISGREEYAASITPQASQALGRLRAMRIATAADPEQQQNLLRAEPLIEARLALLTELTRLRREQGSEAAVALVRTEQGKAMMDQIDTLLAAVELHETAVLARRRERAEAQTRRTLQTIIVATVASLLLVVLIGYLLKRDITRPISALSQAAEALARGDASHRVTVLRRDEIGTLGAAFNSMASEIERREAELSVANTELVQQNREIQRATVLKSQFLAGMSHELRTPLNAILGFSELLADETPGILNAKQKRFVTHVRTASKHLLQLINDILDLSKIEAGQVEFQLEPFTVSSALAEVLSITRPLSMTKNINVLNQVDTTHALQGDRTRVKQVLYNLLSNAIKFTGKEGEITLRSERVGEMLEVSVSDTGVGIAASDIPVIFEEFKQVGGNTREVKEGTGLGLAIARRLLEQQQGSIRVESVLGAGSKFTFTLPAVAPVALPSAGESVPALTLDNALVGAVLPAPLPLPDANERPALVLVVDDDPAVVELQTHYLSSGGFLVEPAKDGHEGVAKARGLRPDVITLDIMMPAQNGWETLHAIKADPATTDIPVVIVSVVEQRQLAIKLGAADCLVKPVSRSDLLTVVRRLTPRGNGAATVLVVDNDERSAELSSAVLSAIGARPIWLSSGIEALRMIRRSRPEAVLLDLMMPGMDGFEVLGAIREDPLLADLPVYVLTGKDLNEAELQFLSARTQVILRKTGNWRDELQARMGVVVRQRAALKRLA